MTDAERHRLFGPVEFAMTRSALTAVLGQVDGVLPCRHVPVKVGVEACGHHHPPLLAPSAWVRALVVGQLVAWSVHRSRRVAVRTATKNPLLGQLDGPSRR